MDKHSNLAVTITGIFYTYPETPVEISNATDRFHKAIVYHENTILWNKVYFTPGSASYEEKEKDNDAGNLFEQTLKFIVPGEDDTSTALFDALRRPLLVKIDFNKGLSKLIGCEENPARFERGSKTSAKDSQSECFISCLSPDPAWWISSETHD